MAGSPNTAAPAADPAAPVAALPGSVTLYDPKTNAPVVVDAEHAHTAILSGQLNYAPGTRVPVRVGGKIGTVDADELGDAVSKYGATSVSSKAYHEHELQEQYGSTPQAALAFGANALDSATVGLSNAAIGGIGGKGARQYLRNIEEANPTAATAGDVAGFVAPIAADVLSGGTLTPALAAAETARLAERGIVRGAESLATRGAESLAARGAEAAATKGLVRTAAETALLGPTRAVSALGNVAEGAARSIVGKNAESAAARAAQNIIAGGARGVTEGGIYGVGSEVGHQFLQDDPDFTGESLGTAWVHGALIGGALGGATHGVAGMLKNKAPRALAEESGLKAEGRAVDGETKALGEAGRGSAVTNKAADVLISQVDDPKKREVLRKAWAERGEHGFAKHEDLLDDATRSVVKSLDETLAAGHAVDMASFGEAKANQMAKLVPVENLRPARSAAIQVWNDATKVIDDLNSLAAKGGGEGSVKRLGKWLKDFGNRISDERDPAALFDKLDAFKRTVGKESAFGTSPFGRTEASRDFEALYGRIQGALEDESVWGAAATAQREVNAATTEMLGTSKFFNGKYTVSFDSKAGVPIYRANDAAIDGFIKNLTKPSGDLNAEAFAEKIARRQNFLDAVDRNYTFDAAGKAAIATERKALTKMGETIAKTSNDVAQVNQLKRLLDDEKGHGIHGIIGVALDAVTKPGTSLARLAELEATKNRALAKIESGLNSVRSALNGTGERKKPGLFPKTHDSYEERRASVLAAASQPGVLHADLQGATAPVMPHAPQAANAFQRAGIRTIQYLMTEMPKPQPRADSLTPQIDMEAWQPSDQQKHQFDLKYDMAVHPDHALALVAAGTITATHVAALQATRPAYYTKQAQGLKADLDRRTKPVPLEMEASIKTFLGLPQMDPQTQRLMQSASPPTPTDAPNSPLKRPLKLGDSTSLNAIKE